MIDGDGEVLQVNDSCRSGFATKLVTTAYRCAMGGLSFGECSYWVIGWRSLEEVVPQEEVGPLFGRFYGFARSLLAARRKPLSCRPVSCCDLCTEEALALRMIETAQCANYADTVSTASMLLGGDDLGGALETAQALATALARHGLFVRHALD